MKKIYVFLLCLFPLSANAWFFFFIPIPTGWPSALSSQVKTLADSNQTKALAYVGEDKLFGAKYYVWGHYLGDLPQKEAIKIAIDRCNAGLARAKAEMNGSSPRWDFGDKKCELYGFPQMPETAVMPDSKEVTSASDAPTSITPQPEFTIRPRNQFDNSSAPSLYKNPEADKTAQSKVLSQPAVHEIKQTPVLNPLNASDGAKRLIELKSLLDQGLITKSDYDQKKVQILKSM